VSAVCLAAGRVHCARRPRAGRRGRGRRRAARSRGPAACGPAPSGGEGRQAAYNRCRQDSETVPATTRNPCQWVSSSVASHGGRRAGLEPDGVTANVTQAVQADGDGAVSAAEATEHGDRDCGGLNCFWAKLGTFRRATVTTNLPADQARRLSELRRRPLRPRAVTRRVTVTSHGPSPPASRTGAPALRDPSDSDRHRDPPAARVMSRSPGHGHNHESRSESTSHGMDSAALGPGP
jgi:hypothetical protein